MHFVPIPVPDLSKEIPHAHLRAWSKHWLPFLPDISKRSKESVDDLLDLIVKGDVQIGLVWDGEKAHALLGIRYCRVGADTVGEIVWVVGSGMKHWTHLLPELEQYLKEHVRCKRIRPICRPGWSRLIKPQGYRVTHYMMEKIL